MLFIPDNVEWEGLYEKSSVFIDFCGYFYCIQYNCTLEFHVTLKWIKMLRRFFC